MRHSARNPGWVPNTPRAIAAPPNNQTKISPPNLCPPPPTARSPRQTWQSGYSPHNQLWTTIERQHHQPNVNHCAWYPHDLKATGSPGLSQGPSNSECSALAHSSMSLAHKYVNLKEPKDIKEQDNTNIFFKKKKTGFTWNPQPQRNSVQKVFFKFNPLFVVLNFHPLAWSDH